MEIIELLTPAYEVAWLPWAVQYFFLVAVATGAALLAAACAFAPAGSPLARTGARATPRRRRRPTSAAAAPGG